MTGRCKPSRVKAGALNVPSLGRSKSDANYRPTCTRPTSSLTANPPPTDRYIQHRGKQFLALRVYITSGVVRVGGILATIVTPTIAGQTLFASGFIHERVTRTDLPTNQREVALLHALRVLKEWMLDTHQDQRLLHPITMRASSTLAHHQIRKCMRGEGCSLVSPAASGVLREISALPQWLSVDLAYLPFYVPDTFEDEGLRNEIRIHLGQAENLRVAVLPQQAQAWAG